MKVIFSEIDHVFEVGDSRINTLVIENQSLLVAVLSDLNRQLSGEEGRIVVSANDTVLKLQKSCELLTQFVPFDFNTKTLTTKLAVQLEKKGISADYYEMTNETLCGLEKFLYSLSFDLVGDITFHKLNLSSIIKAVGAGFVDEYECLAEKIVDYMELVKEYDGEKLFFTLNLRDFVNDAEMESFMDTVLRHDHKLFMIECRERPLLSKENRYIVDADLCEIC